jgi:tetratricopeptide (TPR) repeat protein
VPPVSPAVRRRLQAVFDRALQSVEKADYDYAHNLLSECLADDPANLIYLQHFLANLAQKYGNNKKGARFAGLKSKASRVALNKAAGKGHWREAFAAACEALKPNPWEVSTLLDVAEAYKQFGSDECQLFTLRWALDASPKDVTVNREAAKTLARLGQFDQAIACWRRVAQARPGDDEATRAVSQLSVEKTIQQGGYDPELLQGAVSDSSALESSVRERVAQARGETMPASVARPPADPGRERALLEAIASAPAQVDNYLQLADLFTAQDRLREATEILSRALAASGGELAIRERLEDTQLRRARQQVSVAERRAAQEKTQEASELARRMADQANQAELEVYAARAARNPGNTLLQYELGLRCKRARKFKEAIQAFQAARDDVRKKASVQLHLGESFQHIRQFTLALSSYEAAIEAADDLQLDTKKLALYRAGVLAAELKDLDRAEKHLTRLAAIDFGYRDVADRLDKLAALRDSV